MGAPYLQKGAAHVFRFDGKDWIEEAKLVGEDAVPGDAVGSSVSLDGNRALVGAHNHALSGLTSTGAAYVFQYDGSQWSQSHKLFPSNPDTFGHFGLTASLDGSVALVGAVYVDDHGNAYALHLDRPLASWNNYGEGVRVPGPQHRPVHPRRRVADAHGVAAGVEAGVPESGDFHGAPGCAGVRR